MAQANALTDRQREYREVYLRSEHWRETRAAALERADNRCQVCGTAGRLEVHHLTYDRIGRERPEDLKVLCRACHARCHELDLRAPWTALFHAIDLALANGPLPTNKIAKAVGRQRNLVLDALREMERYGVVEHNMGSWKALDLESPPAPALQTAWGVVPERFAGGEDERRRLLVALSEDGRKTGDLVSETGLGDRTVRGTLYLLRSERCVERGPRRRWWITDEGRRRLAA